MKEEHIVNWFVDRFESDSVEYESHNAMSGTIILQEELSLCLIKRVFEFEKDMGIRVTNIRNHAFGLCVDIESDEAIENG